MNNYFTEMCSGSEVGSYLKLIDFLHHSTLGLRVIKKKDRRTSRLSIKNSLSGTLGYRNRHEAGSYLRLIDFVHQL